MEFSYKKGTHLKTPANVAGKVCRDLEENGGLTAKRLLEASRPKDAPMHDEFLWDDTEAAERYREHQASEIIRCIVVQPQQIKLEPVRAFISVEDAGRSYHSLDVVLQTADMRKQMLDQALKELQAFELKYSTLSELADFFDAIHQITDPNQVDTATVNSATGNSATEKT